MNVNTIFLGIHLVMRIRYFYRTELEKKKGKKKSDKLYLIAIKKCEKFRFIFYVAHHPICGIELHIVYALQCIELMPNCRAILAESMTLLLHSWTFQVCLEQRNFNTLKCIKILQEGTTTTTTTEKLSTHFPKECQSLRVHGITDIKNVKKKKQYMKKKKTNFQPVDLQRRKCEHCEIERSKCWEESVWHNHEWFQTR